MKSAHDRIMPYDKAWRLIKAGAYQRQTLTHPDVDSELIRNFLFIFARIEYALKRAGFMIKGKDEAVADWDSLANSLKGEIHPNRNSEIRSAVEYLNEYPVEKQVVTNGQLGWRRIHRKEHEHLEQWLLRIVRVVRNNLFHGGKFPDKQVYDVSRDNSLLKASIVLLCEIIHLSPEVSNYFDLLD